MPARREGIGDPPGVGFLCCLERIDITIRTGLPVTMRRAICLAVLAALTTSIPARSQGYPFSQRGSVQQNVALTSISVSYGRPVARGRALFGTLVPWDSIWHPGADSATRVSFSHDVLVEGHPLKAGTYSLWLLPREHASWALIFSRAVHVNHKPYPGEAREALRVDVMPETLSHVESMAIYFPRVIRDEALLRIHWGTTGVSASIKAPYQAPIPRFPGARPRRAPKASVPVVP